MPDTADTTTEPAGQADETNQPPAGQVDDTDEQAQVLLADAVSGGSDDVGNGAGQDQQGKSSPWDDPDVARKEIEKLRREAAGWRTKLREAEPKLTEYQQYLDSRKTEQERLTEAKEAAERELTELRTVNARMAAAATHGLPQDLLDFLGTGTPEEIDERARLLAERLTASTPAPTAAVEESRPVARRPVESLTPGARPASDVPDDPNEAFRAFLSSRRT